jgi:uncharacterized protein YbjQ (UPF0145 family)
MASVEDLERRVDEIERQLRHVLPAKIDAVAYGVSLLHEDVRAIRAIVGGHAAELGEMRQEFRESMEEILRRLPAQE